MICLCGGQKERALNCARFILKLQAIPGGRSALMTSVRFVPPKSEAVGIIQDSRAFDLARSSRIASRGVISSSSSMWLER